MWKYLSFSCLSMYPLVWVCRLWNINEKSYLLLFAHLILVCNFLSYVWSCVGIGITLGALSKSTWLANLALVRNDENLKKLHVDILFFSYIRLAHSSWVRSWYELYLSSFLYMYSSMWACLVGSCEVYVSFNGCLVVCVLSWLVPIDR